MPVRASIRATSRFILRTDISRFYPSIYTHSIPWAIHTKAFAKSNRKKANLGNRLDRWIQNGQDGQTIGVPIGPDTSLVIAEVILSAVDIEIRKRLPSVKVMRHVDDYEFGLRSHSEAEEALAILHEALKEYELEVNTAKTSIIDLPVPVESNWVTDLRNFVFRSTPSGQKSDLIHYFDRAFLLAQDYRHDHVLKYAVQRLQTLPIDPTNWQLVENFLLQCLMVETGTFLPVLKQLIDHHNAGMNVDLATVQDVINYQLESQCPVNHGSEAAWAIWAVIRWNMKIEAGAAKAMSKMSDSVVALLALDAYYSGLIPSGLDTTLWESYLTEKELYGDQWLLAYEANMQGWLTSSGTADYVSGDQYFSILKQLGVHFYDRHRARSAVPTGASVGEGTAPLFSLPE